MIKDLRNNIKFNYFYRDGGNYKIYGSEIFPNPECVKVEEIEIKIRTVLIDGEFFEPHKWGLKRLCFEVWNNDLDHFWNEFESLKPTDEPHTVDRTITEFLKEIS